MTALNSITNRTGLWEVHLSVIELLQTEVDVGVSVPVKNSDWVIRELSCLNEPPNVFPKFLESLHENILQAEQYFRYSTPNELLQSGRDT